MPEAIRQVLGLRKKQARYGYDDVFVAWVLTSLCGGMRLDHITKLHKKLSIIKGLKLPSHDTLGRVLKSMAPEIEKSEVNDFKQVRINRTYFADSTRLNRMLIKASVRCGALKPGIRYKLDIDATYIPTECADSLMGSTSRDTGGFYAMVCLIDSMPVFISLRSGNASPNFQITDTLRKCLSILNTNGISVGKVVSDTAGYNKDLLNFLNENNIDFNIHAPTNKSHKALFKQIEAHKNWENIEIESANYFRDCQVADLNYTMLEQQQSFRMIVARMPSNKKKKQSFTEEDIARRQFVERKLALLASRKMLKNKSKTYLLGTWKEYNGYKYKIIVTNDRKQTPIELLLEYNKRGGAERKFDFMKNDFGWRLPPFMRLNQNLVFLVAAALANNVFRGMVKEFKQHIPSLVETQRLGLFIESFIKVSCNLVDDVFEFLNTDIAYEKIM